ncbi:MAG: flavodoxin-dependent (E)-4-hydroxy-3-methylbut-2-enyl-diphosphate synthase [Holosporales bacterium]|jgi:(E)-4-hydroxy-3-methylbut-2-enyl-diphosphate synthase|nr:flavodoxin-dependent (E)-4-hydroxy-3-methylbut-2-enyl-diphosphate synthase [Holosporales bacterium]
MRRKTKQIFVGNVGIGGDSSISIQTMANSSTEDIGKTINQIREAEEAGCDLIRVSCPTRESTVALREIVKNVRMPIIADIHFNYKRAIEAIDAGACCIRINPGNVDMFAINEIVKAAKYNNVAIRIGVNSGSIEKDILDKYGEPTVEAIVESAVLNCKKLEDLDFVNFKISVKSSDVKTTISAYRQLSSKVNYPLHLGVTEAGTFFPGAIKSAIGIGSLLADGIGDTIRVSLSSNIVDEIKVGKQILKSLSLLKNSVDIISCPTCSRTLIDVIGIAKELEAFCESIKKSLKISVLGCVVNGIGEAMNSDIGIFGFKKGIAKIYVNGAEYCTVREYEVLNTVKELIQNQ